MNRTKGFLSLLTAGMIFGSFPIWIRILNTELTTYQQVGARNFLGMLCAITLVFLLKQRWTMRGVSKKKIAGFGFSYAGSVLLYTLAMLKTTVASAYVMFYVGSVIASLLIGVMVYREQITKQKWIGLVLMGVSLLVFLYPFSWELLSVGVLFALLSGIFDASSSAFRKYLSEKIDRFVISVIQMLFGLGTALGFVLFFHQTNIGSLSPTTLVVLILFSVLLFVISFLLTIGFGNSDLSVGTIVLSSELFFAPLFVAVFMKEIPSMQEIIGGCFVFLAVVVLSMKKELFERKNISYATK